MKQFIILALLATLSACGLENGISPQSPSDQLKSQGHDQGNGADHFSESYGAAWFGDGSKSIRFCMNAAPGFGIDRTVIHRKIIDSFQAWSQYMKDKKVMSYLPPEKFELVPSCDGTEDVKFNFAVSDEDVNRHKGRFSNPVAFTARTAFDEKTGRGRGIIWFAASGTVVHSYFGSVANFPDWTQQGDFDLILRHEIGHIYGVDHVPGTIMDEEIARELSISGYSSFPKDLSIDRLKELVVCSECDLSVDGLLGYRLRVTTTYPDGTSQTELSDSSISNFTLLTGEVPQGLVTSSISGSVEDNLVLKIADNERSFEFPIAIDKWSKTVTAPVGVFKIYQKTPFGEGGWKINRNKADHVGEVYSGSIKARNGTKYAVRINRNLQPKMELPEFTPTENLDHWRLTAESNFIIAIEVDGISKLLFQRSLPIHRD